MGRKVRPVSKETMRLAKKAAEQKDCLKTATPEEKEAWAERLAEDSVRAGEAEYGEDYGTSILDKTVFVETED